MDIALHFGTISGRENTDCVRAASSGITALLKALRTNHGFCDPVDIWTGGFMLDFEGYQRDTYNLPGLVSWDEQKYSDRRKQWLETSIQGWFYLAKFDPLITQERRLFVCRVSNVTHVTADRVATLLSRYRYFLWACEIDGRFPIHSRLYKESLDPCYSIISSKTVAHLIPVGCDEGFSNERRRLIRCGFSDIRQMVYAPMAPHIRAECRFPFSGCSDV